MANPKITIDLNCFHENGSFNPYFNVIQLYANAVEGLICIRKRIDFITFGNASMAYIWNGKAYDTFDMTLVSTNLDSPYYARFHIDVFVFVDLLNALHINNYEHYTQNGDLTPLDVAYYGFGEVQRVYENPNQISLF